MKRLFTVVLILGAAGLIALLAYFAHQGGMPLLFPSGSIGKAETRLMVHATLLMLIVVLPVFGLIMFIAIRYRAQNTKATYTPDWHQSYLEEFIWWAIPFEIVLVLGALTWSGTHALNPDRLIASANPPVVVQVVALPAQWLFIYPDAGVASANELVIPAGTPVTFQISADAPMNSFWIPELGGQEYAMSGMVSTLNLVADTAGEYTGRSANYSGEGFADMTFPVHSLSPAAYADWMERVHGMPAALDTQAYAQLAAATSRGPIAEFGSVSYPFASIVHRSMGMDAAGGAMGAKAGGEAMDTAHMNMPAMAR